MGKAWDTGDTAFSAEFWAEVYRVLKPGGHVVAFGGTRTYHRLACAIEDAGFEIRDQLQWLYGSGFPKSHDVSKGIDKAKGLTREIIRERYTALRIKPGATVVAEGAYGKQDITFTATDTKPASPESELWQGWGTALKPACEPIVMARKPLIGTVAANVLEHGTGAINIDGCRVGTDDDLNAGASKLWSYYRDGEASAERRYTENGGTNFAMMPGPRGGDPAGRWPANIVHDGSDEVVAAFPDAPGQHAAVTGNEPSSPFANVYGDMPSRARAAHPRGDSGSAARFFYSAKADADDRFGSKHPTVKPVDLMRWLVRLVTPPKGIVLDPFAGSGATGAAAMAEGMDAILIEREAEYVADIQLRMAHAEGRGAHSGSVKARNKKLENHGPLFGVDK